MRSLTDVSILQCRREIFFRRGMDSVRWFSRSHQSKISVSRFVHLSSAGTCHGSDTFQQPYARHCLTNVQSLNLHSSCYMPLEYQRALSESAVYPAHTLTEDEATLWRRGWSLPVDRCVIPHAIASVHLESQVWDSRKEAAKAGYKDVVGVCEIGTHCSAWGDALAASEVQVAELREAVHGVQSDPRTLCGNQGPHRSTGPPHLYMQSFTSELRLTPVHPYL